MPVHFIIAKPQWHYKLKDVRQRQQVNTYQYSSLYQGEQATFVRYNNFLTLGLSDKERGA
jgi:hypothetical protein